jgi:hypothetical protein
MFAPVKGSVEDPPVEPDVVPVPGSFVRTPVDVGLALASPTLKGHVAVTRLSSPVNTMECAPSGSVAGTVKV